MSRCLLETKIDQAWWMTKWHEKDFKDKDQGHPTTVNNHEKWNRLESKNSTDTMVESCGNAQTQQFRNSELRGMRGFIVQAGRLIEASAQELTLTILVKTPQICG